MTKTIKNRPARLLCLALVCALVLALLSACGTGNTENPETSILTLEEQGIENPGLARFDVLAGLDASTVSTQDGVTSFTSYDAEGRAVRFCTTGTLTEDGLVLNPAAYLLSLDALGQIHYYSPLVKDAAGTPPEDLRPDLMNIGAVYTQSGVDSVLDLQQLTGDFVTGLPVADCWGYAVEVKDFLPNYVLVAADLNLQVTTLQELAVWYDPAGPATNYSAIDYAMRPLTEIPQMNMTLQPMPEGVVTQECDIIAAIDRSTVTTQGDTTLFSSVMPDGAVVRFEGRNITVEEGGLRVGANARLCSLDSVGQIHCLWMNSAPGASATFGTLIGTAATFSQQRTSVESGDELITAPTFWNAPADYAEEDMEYRLYAFLPNFVCMTSEEGEGDFLLESLRIEYDPTVKTTAIRALELDAYFYGAYLNSDVYEPEKELYADDERGNFYLIATPEAPWADNVDNGSSLYFIKKDYYTTGDLKAADGTVLDKNNTKMTEGITLDVTIGDYTIPVEIPMVERFAGAQNMNDLVPYAFPEATSEMDVLVVPVFWRDQPETATDEALDNIRTLLGRVEAADGTVSDHSPAAAAEFSFSEYFDAASYGKTKITSFLTDWYMTDRDFAEYKDQAADLSFGVEALNWVKENYPDLDWTRYDRDANGYVDSLLLLNVGESGDDYYNPGSYGGGNHYLQYYTGAAAGTPQSPTVNCYVNVNKVMLDNAATLIHEYGHTLGLIDYYDVSYSGIDAVGSFDMQSSNFGDWNGYSKYAVGWVQPQVVTGLASGESAEYTIGAFSLTDDLLVIPAAGTEHDGPFSEYIMLDLFTTDGANAFGSDMFGLTGATGVRITHVNANMEKHIETAPGPDGTMVEYPIGTIHYANNYRGDIRGRYNVEVIQAGGENTFTDPENPDSTLSADDLFRAGDVFTAEAYDEFLYNGRMDGGDVFGYTVEIVRIGTGADGLPAATIRVTAQ